MMNNTNLFRLFKIIIWTIFLNFSFILNAQWDADAGYIPSLTIGKTPIPSSGTDANLGIDGSPNNHWTSGDFIDIIQEDKDAYIYAFGDANGNISHYVAWKPIDGNDTATSMVTFNSGMQTPSFA
jgi:hypothetical protein